MNVDKDMVMVVVMKGISDIMKLMVIIIQMGKGSKNPFRFSKISHLQECIRPCLVAIF